MEHVWNWLLDVCRVLLPITALLCIPAVQNFLGRFLGRFIEYSFDQKIEGLKSELRQTEQRLEAELRAKEAQIQTLAHTALTVASTRQSALDARRLKAVEHLWAAKIWIDRWRIASTFVAGLNLEEMRKSADDPRIQEFAKTLETAAGTNIENAPDRISANSERPFIPPHIWLLLEAYQGVIFHSVAILKAFAMGTSRFLRWDDPLKPTMLIVVPEYTDYIEKYGFAGYDGLLQTLEQKLLAALTTLLEGQEVDHANLQHSAKLMAAARAIDAVTVAEAREKTPAGIRANPIPAPSSTV